MNEAGASARIWRVGPGLEIALDQPRLMGILNLTPDSFSDGGAFASNADAVEFGLQLAHEGASIIDVGGESTRPGAKSIPPVEQIRRTIPVIRGLQRRLDPSVHISIDTTSAQVAEAALVAGASIINDVSAGLDDAKMLPLAASRKCGLILMHRLAHNPTTPHDYGPDIVATISNSLRERCQAAVTAGVDPASIVIDPGLGFGKTVEQNYELIGRIHELGALNYPVLSAASRKSFIGAALVAGAGVHQPAARVVGSTAVSVMHLLHGVRLFRVHDVAAHREALAVAAAAIGANGQLK